jgi:micrococcal nuclease
VEPFGPEASAFTKRFLAGGQVRLQFDHERVDQYGRTLAYAWVGDKLLNEELVRQGLARAEMQYHYSQGMKRRFREAQDEARAAHRGIWSQPAAGRR